MNHQGWIDRARRNFGDRPVAEVIPKVRAIVGPSDIPARLGEDAQLALDALRAGCQPTPAGLQALEQAIRLLRPVVLSARGKLAPLDPVLKELPCLQAWDGFAQRAERYLLSIGRIEESNGKLVGTGFLVGEGLLATNRHVLDQVTRGTAVLEPGQARVRFGAEHGVVPDPSPVTLDAVERLHPSQDIVLLRLSEDEQLGGKVILPISTAPPPAVGTSVATVGYPAEDSFRNPLFVQALFHNKFGVKRVAPGELTGRGAGLIHHDCSTLGGNSGSPVFAMAGCEVVGLHRNGYFLSRNEAVDGPSLCAFVKGEE